MQKSTAKQSATLLTSKYAPKKLDEIIGNDEKIALIRSWMLQWIAKKPRNPLLIYGPAGTGKTSVAYALAAEYDYDVIEMNASELRNRGRVEKVLGGASLASGLFGKGHIVLLDDIDVLSGRSDYGGGSTIAGFLKEATCPIILTASDIWDKKLS